MAHKRAIDRMLPARDAEELAVAIVVDRLKLLSEIARHRIEAPVTAGHRIAAIAELNKLEGSYPPERHLIAGEVVLRIVRDELPAGTSNTQAVIDVPACKTPISSLLAESSGPQAAPIEPHLASDSAT